jgi:hypothetical protein
MAGQTSSGMTSLPPRNGALPAPEHLNLYQRSENKHADNADGQRHRLVASTGYPIAGSGRVVLRHGRMVPENARQTERAAGIAWMAQARDQLDAVLELIHEKCLSGPERKLPLDEDVRRRFPTGGVRMRRSVGLVIACRGWRRCPARPPIQPAPGSAAGCRLRETPALAVCVD